MTKSFFHHELRPWLAYFKFLCSISAVPNGSNWSPPPHRFCDYTFKVNCIGFILFTLHGEIRLLTPFFSFLFQVNCLTWLPTDLASFSDLKLRCHISFHVWCVIAPTLFEVLRKSLAKLVHSHCIIRQRDEERFMEVYCYCNLHSIHHYACRQVRAGPVH